MEFEGKAIIITGSSRGIGRAAALAFVKLGASVTIHGQNADKLNETKELLRKAGAKEKQIVSVLGPIQEEKTVKELVEKTVDEFGRIDVLINNAGIRGKPGETDFHSLANFDYIFAVNLRSVVQLTQLATPHLAKTKGVVINISSIAASLSSMKTSFYGMTKIALDHYSRDMANVLGQEHGIRVNTISPGPIESEFMSRWGEGEQNIKTMKESFTKRVISQRFGSCEELADAIVFMAGPKASYIWGATLVVDGGTLPFAFY